MRTVIFTMVAAAAALALAPHEAAAQARRLGPTYSVLGARAVPEGLDLLALRGGWPEASLEYLHGIGAGTDLGLRAAARLGVESTSHARAGAALSVPLRVALASGPRLAVALRAAPGVGCYAYAPAAVGLELPVGLVLELPTRPELTWGAAIDLRASVLVSGTGAPHTFLGPLAGPFLEWRIDRKVSLGIEAQVGSVHGTHAAAPGLTAGASNQLGLHLQIMVSERL